MKTVTIPFRVTAAERAELKHMAHQNDMTVSEYIRWLIAKQKKEQKSS